jgi:hypothetical protein
MGHIINMIPSFYISWGIHDHYTAIVICRSYIVPGTDCTPPVFAVCTPMFTYVPPVYWNPIYMWYIMGIHQYTIICIPGMFGIIISSGYCFMGYGYRYRYLVLIWPYILVLYHLWGTFVTRYACTAVLLHICFHVLPFILLLYAMLYVYYLYYIFI